MRCDGILERILEADLDDLTTESTSTLGMHLRRCDRCRAVAAQVVADTRLLRRALVNEAVSPLVPERAGASGRSRSIRQVALAGLAAATIAITMLRGGGNAVDATRLRAAPPGGLVRARGMHGALGTPQSGARAARGHEATMRAVRASRGRTPPTRGARAIVAKPVRAVEFPKARPVSPVEFTVAKAAPPVAENGARVASIDPAPGKRVAILRTSDPTVTVVWLY